MYSLFYKKKNIVITCIKMCYKKKLFEKTLLCYKTISYICSTNINRHLYKRGFTL